MSQEKGSSFHAEKDGVEGGTIVAAAGTIQPPVDPPELRSQEGGGNRGAQTACTERADKQPRGVTAGRGPSTRGTEPEVRNSISGREGAT